jgi:hypothetical protein
VIALVVATTVGGAAVGSVALLPRPSSGAVLGARMARNISTVGTVRAVERVGGWEVSTVCRKASASRYLLVIGGRERLLIAGIRLAGLERGWSQGNRLDAEVVLAGCPPLLTALLERKLLPAFAAGPRSSLAVTGRGSTVWIALTERLALEVRRRAYMPVGLRLSGRGLSGTSRLVVAPPRRPV